MKAVILAGGKGTRLYPLTQSRPKPMVPLLGAPILAHTLALLAYHKVTEAVLTVGYLSEVITSHFKDRFCGIDLSYSGESLPLGTAGAVRACRSFTDEDPFVVISGDAVTDADLGAAYAYHLEKNAAATLILKRCPDPTEFGVVRTDPSGRITGFVEKPEWSEVCSDKVNTGIYILSPRVLDPVPEKTHFDFSRDLFPRLLESGEALFGYVADGYWCDVGNPDAYRKCASDALAGKVRLYLYSPDGSVSGSISHQGYVDPAASVAAGALVKNSVILSGSVVESGALVTDSVVAENCFVRGGAVVKDSVLDRDTSVGSGAVVCAGSVAGEGSRFADGTLCASRRLAPGAQYSFSGIASREPFYENGVFVFSSGDRQALSRFGSALSKSFGLPVSVSGPDQASVGALCAGASAAGCFSSDADSPAVSSFAAAVMGCVCAHIENSPSSLFVSVFMPDGYRIGPEDRRRLTGIFRSSFDLQETSVRAEGLFIRRMYVSRLAASLPAGCPPFACDSSAAANALIDAARLCFVNKKGADAAMVFGFSDGSLSVRFPDGESFDMLRVIRLFSDTGPRRRVYLEPPLPSLFTDCTPGVSALDDVSRKAFSPITLDRLYFHDPAFAAARLLEIASLSGADALEKKLGGIPPVFVEKRFVVHNGSLESFAGKISLLADEGLLDGESVRIVPGGPGAFRIWAQSTGTEAARELCDRAQRFLSD